MTGATARGPWPGLQNGGDGLQPAGRTGRTGL